MLGDGAEVELVADGHAAAPGHDRTMLSGAWTPPDEDALSPKLTFDQFVIGDCNRFAHAAALAVAELPGQAYNPLFIYGPPGVGKTHLLHSIGNYVRRFGEGLTVRATTTEQLHERLRHRAAHRRARRASRAASVAPTSSSSTTSSSSRAR